MVVEVMQFEEIVFKEIPVRYKCDICGREFELIDDYDLEYESDVSKQMSVVRYGHPSGGFRDDTIYEELHCCSSECVLKAIKKVPFDATITIPMSENFIK